MIKLFNMKKFIYVIAACCLLVSCNKGPGANESPDDSVLMSDLEGTWGQTYEESWIEYEDGRKENLEQLDFDPLNPSYSTSVSRDFYGHYDRKWTFFNTIENRFEVKCYFWGKINWYKILDGVYTFKDKAVTMKYHEIGEYDGMEIPYNISWISPKEIKLSVAIHHPSTEEKEGYYEHHVYLIRKILGLVGGE